MMDTKIKVVCGGGRWSWVLGTDFKDPIKNAYRLNNFFLRETLFCRIRLYLRDLFGLITIKIQNQNLKHNEQ